MKLKYYKDIADNYDGLLSASYEKANIWPMTSALSGIDIMDEEIDEAFGKVDAMMRCWDLATGHPSKETRIPTATDMKNVKAYALSAILELLQVMAVCNKYQLCFDEAHREGGDDA